MHAETTAMRTRSPRLHLALSISTSRITITPGLKATFKMKIFGLFVMLATAGLGLAATCSGSRQCQCLFQDGSHCCLYGSVCQTICYSTLSLTLTQNMMTGDDYDCTRLCSGASRLLQSGENTPAKCNAGGRFSCASIFTSQTRTPCYNNAEVRNPGTIQES